MSLGTPESYSDRIERQDRRDQRKEVEARQKKLEEKHGTTTIVTESEGRHGMGRTTEVKGADCPDCEDGVIRVVSRPNSYPNFEEICTECGSI